MSNRMKLRGNKTTGIDLSVDSLAYAFSFADGEGATVGGMSNDDPNTDDEDGFITILVDGVARKIPFWNDD